MASYRCSYSFTIFCTLFLLFRVLLFQFTSLARAWSPADVPQENTWGSFFTGWILFPFFHQLHRAPKVRWCIYESLTSWRMASANMIVMFLRQSHLQGCLSIVQRSWTGFSMTLKGILQFWFQFFQFVLHCVFIFIIFFFLENGDILSALWAFHAVGWMTGRASGQQKISHQRTRKVLPWKT